MQKTGPKGTTYSAKKRIYYYTKELKEKLVFYRKAGKRDAVVIE